MNGVMAEPVEGVPAIGARTVHHPGSHCRQAGLNLARLEHIQGEWMHRTRGVHGPDHSNFINNFRQVLEQTPQFHHSNLLIAVWYRATWEPGAVWKMLTPILPN